MRSTSNPNSQAAAEISASVVTRSVVNAATATKDDSPASCAKGTAKSTIGLTSSMISGRLSPQLADRSPAARRDQFQGRLARNGAAFPMSGRLPKTAAQRTAPKRGASDAIRSTTAARCRRQFRACRRFAPSARWIHRRVWSPRVDLSNGLLVLPTGQTAKTRHLAAEFHAKPYVICVSGTRDYECDRERRKAATCRRVRFAAIEPIMQLVATARC